MSMKMNELALCITRLINFTNIMLSKKARSKCTYGIISFICISDVVSGDRHSKRVIFHGGSSNCETQLIILSYS